MATQDPRRCGDTKDAQPVALYAKDIAATGDDQVNPLTRDSNGYLLVNLTVGTISVTDTAATITNAVGNPANVSLTETRITAHIAPSASVVTVHLSPSASLATVALSPTKVTVEATQLVDIKTAVEIVDDMIAGNVARVMGVGTAGTPSGGVLSIQGVASMTALDVTLTATKVTVESAGLNVTLTSTKVTVDNTATVALSSTVVTSHLSPTTTKVTIDNNLTLANTGVTISVGRTLTGATGTVSATWTSIFTPTNRAKVYALSFTTTSSSEVTVLVCDGAFANAKEFWRVTLRGPSTGMAGANLAVSPPAFLFATRSASAVTVSLSTALLVHYSLAFFDEA